jgi:putative Ca2+/H+ antiporter (TMEM165/GDT1 family)
VDAFAAALGVVFVAELGDKSQLLALSLATRHGARPVLAGLALASAALMAVSVAVGGAVSRVVPARLIEVACGIAFLVVAAVMLWRPEDDEKVDDEVDAVATATSGRVLAVAAAIGAAELGDKTMLATFTLAATNGVLATWAGATVGMVAAGSIAVLVGSQLRTRLPERVLRLVAAGLFAVVGAALLISATVGRGG